MNAEAMIPGTFRWMSRNLEIANEDLGYLENFSGLYEWLEVLGEVRCDGAAKTKDCGSTNGRLGSQGLMSHRAPWNHTPIATFQIRKACWLRTTDIGRRPQSFGLLSET